MFKKIKDFDAAKKRVWKKNVLQTIIQMPLKMKLTSVSICKRNPKLLKNSALTPNYEFQFWWMLPGSTSRNSSKYRLKIGDDDDDDDPTRRHGKSVLKILYILNKDRPT